MDHDNPYAAPTEPSAPADPAAGDSTLPAPLPLATRSARFAGACIDTFVEWGFRWVVTRLAADWLQQQVPSTLEEANRITAISRLAFFGSTALVLGTQAFLVARRGQSIGKMFTDTRIVRSDGRHAGFFRAFVVRTLPFTSLSWSLVTAAGSYSFRDAIFQEVIAVLWASVLLLDALLIFGARRRCGHDLLAGTIVVQARSHADRVADPDDAPARRTKKPTKKPKKLKRPEPAPADLP